MVCPTAVDVAKKRFPFTLLIVQYGLPPPDIESERVICGAPVELIESEVDGVEVPIPTLPFPLTPSTVKAGELEPWLETVKEFVNVEPISTASLASIADGELVPIPTAPPMKIAAGPAPDCCIASVG